MFFTRTIVAFTLLLTTYGSQATEVDYRLPSHVTPSFQQITLKIDPDSPDFSGETTINVDITKATNSFKFYQKDLIIQSAVLIQGDTHIPLTLKAADYDMEQASSEQTIKADRYKLHMVFTGKVNTTSDGMYLSKFEGLNYIFTQFEDMLARRAFPSFDEPDYKIPYQMTISAPEKHTVLSNTPVVKRSVSDGWQTVQFDKTKSMPSYLVAFAVGEFDSAEITGLSVPGKIYTPKGQAHRTKFAVKHTPQILSTLEAYFGSSYPYQKLDFIAVPNFTHGAMENVGLVTYRSSLLLLDDEPRLTEQRGPLVTIAHELAHMWYGNLVTMAWWDDLWLNEAFASWMATKVMLTLYPEHNYQNRLVQENAFGADARPTTKPVKKVVRTQTDVMDGLGLNYSKGESVLQMIEALVGEEAFQKGVQSYMKKHAWRNTEADDLWKVLSSVADFDVPQMMRTYLEQPAYPLLEFSSNGDIVQSRYHLSGADVKDQTWIVPLSLSYKKNGQIERLQFFMDKAKQNVAALAEADWIFPNENAMGYMRWNVSPEQFTALLADIDTLNGREKKSFLYNSDALLKAGKITLAQHMAAIDALVAVEDPMIARAVVSSLGDLEYLVDDSNEALFAKFVEAKLMPWFTRLGIESNDNDSDDVSRLKTSVFSMLADYSQNPLIRELSLDLSKQFLADTGSVSRSIAYVALLGTAKHSSEPWFEKYKAAYLASNDANIRSTLRYSMRFKEADTITNVLNLSLSDDVGPADTIGLVSIATNNRKDKSVLYNWLEKNIDKLVEKLPAYHLARMPEYLSSSCDKASIELAETFYKDRMQQHEGMQRSFDIALAGSLQCIELKALNQNDFTEYLKSH